MREIKFRAWIPKSSEMVYEGWNGDIFYSKREIFAQGEDAEVMQYTGLKDKNGEEIYEGDIEQDGGRIFYNESIAAFQIDYGGDVDIADMEDVDKWMVVSGNIYESPELLNPLKQQS